MKNPPSPARHFIMDANVLIDYCKSDKSILSLIANHVASVHLASPVLDEVKQLNIEEVQRLNLDLVEPETDQVIEAGSRGGPLSFQDHLCLILAELNGWTCVTNDGRLRKECRALGIETIRGLEPLILLNEGGKISCQTALNYARKIQETNPRYITDQILQRFKSRLQG
jgi:rRNA-processing protein FCF1